ncbi:MAG: signal peptide peptidase SppA [Muribaculaceae bacterium]|nr:signal peptide peptidase SppA [Muribaculaceae bacterium]
MLKRFFLNALSSFLGAWIALVLFGVVAVLVILGMVTRLGMSQNDNQNVSKNSVMVINLSGEITEHEIPVELDYNSLLLGNIVKNQTLSELVAAIGAASKNSNIDAIYLKCGVLVASPATLNALRNALITFKESGKKIIAYGDVMTMGDYYIASVADDICLNPGGKILLQGLGGFSLFYKGLLDKLGIEVQMVKVGTFKSAVEPYVNTEMSAPARAQLDTLYGNMWDFILEGISQNRETLTPTKIDSLVGKDFIFIRNAEKDLRSGLIDHLYYERSMDSVIASAIGKDKDDINFVAPSLLVGQEDFAIGQKSTNQIAVLYACGEILDGGGATTINYERYVPIITGLADDNNVKGMVLRVNSPGGSVFGSEQIGEALDYFQSKGKPLAVSMGDYAASGGYWISCCANKIFADPLTVTGSIGIFGLIPNIEGLMKKIGLHAEIVSTNPDALFPTLVKPMNPAQLQAMQEMVEEGYDMFVSRVAKGRNLSKDEVRRIGEGRVWDARTAMKIGLVDSLGSLQDAIEWIAKDLEIANYGVTYYPKLDNSIWSLLPELLEMKQHFSLPAELTKEISLGSWIKITNLLNQYPLQARMPEINVGFNYREIVDF